MRKPMGTVLLRALASVTIVGALYAAYLWISGDKIRPVFVMIIVAVPAILTALKLMSHKSDLHSKR
jgi:hypothetical protein